jgi:PPOX class probable F420-dependent enzyme
LAANARARSITSIDSGSSASTIGAAPIDESRNRRRDIPRRRAVASDSSRVRRIASVTRSLAGRGANSPFDAGSSLIGSPGSTSRVEPPSHRTRDAGVMDISEAIAFIRDHHRAVLHTFRRDGGPQLSPVSVGVDDQGRPIVSSRETAIKTKNLVRSPRAALCMLNDGFYGEWCVVEGSCEVVHLPEAMDLLVDYYRQLSGEHPDWDDYREAMVREQRVILRMTPERAGPNVSG